MRWLSFFERIEEQIARLNPKRFRNLSEHGDARRHVAALDRADIARAQAGALGQLLLRHALFVAFSTQVQISLRSMPRWEPEQE